MDLPNQTSKRVRDDTHPNSPVSKMARVDSDDSSVQTHIQNDLFNILDDTENVPDRMHGLDSVIKSFEQEILSPTPHEPGDFHVDLGFLLEASDDELGLPPSTRPESQALGRAGPEEADNEGLLDLTESYDVVWRSESLQAM